MTNPDEYDVCLLLEGTYPFVAGGVSSWIHNLIKALPEVSFTGVCILPNSNEKWTPRYEMPPNFTNLKVIYLHEYEVDQKKRTSRKIRLEQINCLRNFHKEIQENNYNLFDLVLSYFDKTTNYGMTAKELIYGKDAWRLLVDFYKPEENQESFMDYFWTYRFTHLPIYKLLTSNVPKARVYHTISTGYAGLLGVVAKALYNRPLLLTEHGIYTKERKIEISQAEWIYVSTDERIRIKKDLGVFQKIWINFFTFLGRVTYQKCDQIYTLHEGNRQIEIAEGADPEKTFVIPNGINIEKFSKLKPREQSKEVKGTYNVGFVGRVVPIKDVKTFLRACKIVSLKLDNVKFYIMGPVEEDPDYYQECIDLVELLKLEAVVEFTGKINVMDYYPILDLIVLTSVSESQPLVILEGACAGIPSVASDVGSCKELLEGRIKEDQALGHSGIITRVADPVDTADGIVKILSSDLLRHKMATAGRKRVEKFYRESDLNKKYLSIYEKYISYEPK